MKRDDGRIHQIASDTSSERRRWRQDGPKCKLLCPDCEHLINERYEKPFFSMWFDNPIYPQPFSDGIMVLRVPDPKAFQLFHMSVLWRAGAAAIREGAKSVWRHVYLHLYEPRLRDLVLCGDPGRPYEFPIIAYFMTNPIRPYAFEPSLFLAPYQGPLSGMHCIRMVFAGVSWIYFVSGHCSLEVANFCMQPDGRMPIQSVPFTEDENFMQVAREHFARLDR
jgi:hypothetical protein